jgi:hypothetical protein
MYRKKQKLTRADIVNPDMVGGTFSAQDMAKKEFFDFVTTTHRELAKSEARELGGKSSITVFCRMDIGIILDPLGKAFYFVNEVERMLMASLWSKCPGMPLKTFTGTFGYMLHKSLSSIMSM